MKSSKQQQYEEQQRVANTVSPKYFFEVHELYLDDRASSASSSRTENCNCSRGEKISLQEEKYGKR